MPAGWKGAEPIWIRRGPMSTQLGTFVCGAKKLHKGLNLQKLGAYEGKLRTFKTGERMVKTEKMLLL